MAVLDRDVLRKLERLKPGLAGKMVQSFLGHAPARIEACRAGVAGGDWVAVEHAAHGLKSSAGQLGADSLFDICGRLEATAPGGDAAAVSSLSAELEAVFARTVEALKEGEGGWNPRSA